MTEPIRTDPAIRTRAALTVVRKAPKQGKVFAGETTFTLELILNGVNTGIYIDVDTECEDTFARGQLYDVRLGHIPT